MGKKQKKNFFFWKKKSKWPTQKNLFSVDSLLLLFALNRNFHLWQLLTTTHQKIDFFRPRTIQFNLEWCLLSRLIQASTQESSFLLLLVKLTHLLVIYFCSCKSHILKTNFCSQILTQKINPLYGERFRDSYSAVKGYVFIFTSSFPPLSSFDENIFLEFSFYYHILRIL